MPDENKCMFPLGPSKVCNNPATHEYKLGKRWLPCCDTHKQTATNIKMKVRKLE